MTSSQATVATLIPAYKTKYIGELLVGLALQTRRSDRIIISDDSPDGEFGRLLDSPALAGLRAGLPIEVHPGPRNGAYENFKHLIKLWGDSSDFVHLLLDDDLIYPEFYEQHLGGHRQGRFSCSISARWTAAENGQPIRGMPVPLAVKTDPARLLALDAGVMFTTTVPECKNWFGEFSNCILTRETAPLLLKPEFEGVSYAGLWDLGAFLAASLVAPVLYIQERLGAFRTGGEGHSAQLMGKHMKAAHLGYSALALGGKRLGQLSAEQARQCYAGIAPALVQRYGEQADMQVFAQLLFRMAAGEAAAEAEFLDQWHGFLASHQL